MTNKARNVRRNYSSPDSSVCEVCQAEFGGPEVLKMHKLAHFNTVSTCYICDQVLCSKPGQNLGASMSMHVQTQHKLLATPTGTYKPEAERCFVCAICLQRFSSNKILTLHTMKQHGTSEGNTFNCKICSLDFCSATLMQVHMKTTRHRDMKVCIQGLFMCVDCRAVFPGRDAYAMHMMMRAQTESCSPLVVPDLDNTNSEASELSQKSEHSQQSGKHTTNQNDATSSVHKEIPNQDSLHDILKHAATNRLMKLASGFQYLHQTRAGNSAFRCGLCSATFDTCDSLAMHTMDQHAGNSVCFQQIFGYSSPMQPFPGSSFPLPNSQASSSLKSPQSLLSVVLPSYPSNGKSSPQSVAQAGRRSAAVSCSPITPVTAEKTAKICSKCSEEVTDLEEIQSYGELFPSESQNSFKCKSCLQTLSNNEELEKSIDNEVLVAKPSHTGTILKCELCDLSFYDIESFVVHNSTIKHLMEKKPDMYAFSCLVCGFGSTIIEEAVNHSKSHTEQEKPPCSSSESDENVEKPAAKGSQAGRGKTRASRKRKITDENKSSTGNNNNNKVKRPSVSCSSGASKADINISALETETSECDLMPTGGGLVAIPVSPAAPEYESSDPLLAPRPSYRSYVNGSSYLPHALSRSSLESDNDSGSLEGEGLLNFVLGNLNTLVMCKHCNIIYTDRTMYYLHVGLHNIHNPWQCNLCGKICRNVHEFSSHIMHFS